MDVHFNHRVYRAQDRDAYRMLYCAWLNIMDNSDRDGAEFLALVAELRAAGRVV